MVYNNTNPVKEAKAVRKDILREAAAEIPEADGRINTDADRMPAEVMVRWAIRTPKRVSFRFCKRPSRKKRIVSSRC